MFEIKHKVKTFLLKTGRYHDLKYSPLFRIYQQLFKPQVIKNHNTEVAFYRSFLSPCDLIFDIGAFDGHKTAAFLTCSKKVVCCEPDSQNIEVLRSRFRNDKTRVFIEHSAVSDKGGQEVFHVHHKGSAFNTLSTRWKDVLEADKGTKWDKIITFSEEQYMVSVLTIDNLIQKYGKPYFIKIDVEGSETKVLAGLSQTVPYLSFESLLPEFVSELHQCLSIIGSLASHATYNIAENEKLLFPSFVSIEKLKQWIAEAEINHFEVIVKME